MAAPEIEALNDHLVALLRPQLEGKKVVFSDSTFISSIPLLEHLGVADYRLLSLGTGQSARNLGNKVISAPGNLGSLDNVFTFFNHPELQDWAQTALDRWDPGRQAVV